MITLLICSFTTITAQGQDYLKLIGTWKVDGKAKYEFWELQSAGHLVGKSYSLQDGQQKVTETLSIIVSQDEVIYQATVPDQNNGATIPFTLNQQEKKALSFENLTHDFPKKIKYTFIAEDEILVAVLGANDEGFDYIMKRL